MTGWIFYKIKNNQRIYDPIFVTLDGHQIHNMPRKNALIILSIFGLNSFIPVAAQNRIPDLAREYNPIITGASFLAWHAGPSLNGEITSVPDGTMGPETYGNPGLPALDRSRFGTTVDYAFWPRQTVHGMFMAGFGVHYRLNDRHTAGISIRSYSSGTQVAINILKHTIDTIHTLNYSAAAAYTWNINNLTGIGAAIRFISVGRVPWDKVGDQSNHNRFAFAADIGFARQFPGRNRRIDQFLGISLNNMGTRIESVENSPKLFLPAKLTAGYGIRANISGRQCLSLSYELSKLMVPTPPAYDYGSLDSNFNPTIKAGYNPDVGAFRGMIQSFYDAPGGYLEELHEINHSFGLVYHYRFISAGAGYHFEHPTKGNSQVWSFGLAGDFRIGRSGTTGIQVNLSYVMPLLKMHNPFGRMIRFGLNVSLGNKRDA